MEVNHKNLNSIWGQWWVPIRKWFYPTWLLYEVALRFYGYSLAIHEYFLQQEWIADNISKFGTRFLISFCSIATFIICNTFLTLPACFVLFAFLTKENLTGYQFEKKLKFML